MPQITASRYLVTAGWDDVPHLDARTKAELLASTPPHLRDARTKGIPSLGSGAVYPIPLDEVLVAPFRIPAFWPRAYALDVGWKRTAALWGALDRETDTLVCYSEHYAGQAVPAVHASAIKARGEWIPGVVDPASRGRAQGDGEQLIDTYRGEGLKLTPAKNAVESGLFDVYQRLTTGRLKFFTTLTNLQAEYRMYRRNERGAIIKDYDHLMDCLRYLTVSGIPIMRTQAPERATSAARTSPADATAGY
jgi:hypothetical protein